MKMNNELQAFTPHDSMRLGVNDEATKAAEKLLADTFDKGGCRDKCLTVPEPKKGEYNRFLMPSEMDIEPLNEKAFRRLSTADAVISQKGSNQSLNLLATGESIDINGDGTFAVR